MEGVGGGGGGGVMRSRRGRQDRSSLGRNSPTGTWSRIGPIAKHKKVRGGLIGSLVDGLSIFVCGKRVEGGERAAGKLVTAKVSRGFWAPVRGWAEKDF